MIDAAIRNCGRCPTNFELESAMLPDLAREGLYRIEVFAKNFRVVTACKGPLAGKHTALPPAHYGAAYVVIDSLKTSREYFRSRSTNKVMAEAAVPVNNGEADESLSEWITDEQGNLTRTLSK